ncbi:MAG: hypothetical protein KKC42_03090, partial [Candidatus Omnitrophica bacterium]|nr:hypothetical protein [Candidatus Omnitrophota bacterium]
ATLGGGDRNRLLRFIKSDKFEKFLKGELEVSGSRRLRKKVKVMLEKARVMNNRAKLFVQEPRNIKFVIKNLKGSYIYEKYVVDSSCQIDCPFKAVETKEVVTSDVYTERLTMNPYSLNLIILDLKPAEAEEEKEAEEPAVPAVEETALPEEEVQSE